MAFYKVIFSIEKIVECDNYHQEAASMARNEISSADYYDCHAYELTEEDLKAPHNLQLWSEK